MNSGKRAGQNSGQVKVSTCGVNYDGILYRPKCIFVFFRNHCLVVIVIHIVQRL